MFTEVPFKIMISPKVTNDGKGGTSFKKSKGTGFVQLKCEADLSRIDASVKFRISIGSGETLQGARGPISHNFSQRSVCHLPPGLDEWDFSTAVDRESRTFAICLEIVPYAGG